jgi:hypothetical protein
MDFYNKFVPRFEQNSLLAWARHPLNALWRLLGKTHVFCKYSAQNLHAAADTIFGNLCLDDLSKYTVLLSSEGGVAQLHHTVAPFHSGDKSVSDCCIISSSVAGDFPSYYGHNSALDEDGIAGLGLTTVSLVLTEWNFLTKHDVAVLMFSTGSRHSDPSAPGDHASKTLLLPLFLGAVIFITVSMTGCAAFHLSPDTLPPLSCGVLAPLLSLPQAAASVIIHSVVGIIMSRMSAQAEDPRVSSAHSASLAVFTGAYTVALFNVWLAMRMMSGEEDKRCSRAELFSMHALLCVGQVVIICLDRRLHRHSDPPVLGDYASKTPLLPPDSRLIDLVPPENQFCIDCSTFEQQFEKACLFLQNVRLEAVDHESSHERHQHHRQESLVILDSEESARATCREHDDFFKPAARELQNMQSELGGVLERADRVAVALQAARKDLEQEGLKCKQLQEQLSDLKAHLQVAQKVQVLDAEIVVPAPAIWKPEDFMNYTTDKLHRTDQELAACRVQMEELENLLRREETQGQEIEKPLEAFILHQQALGTVLVRASQKET